MTFYRICLRQNKQMEPQLTPGREASSSIMPSVANVILDENGDVGDAEVDTGWEEESMVNSEDMEEVSGLHSHFIKVKGASHRRCYIEPILV